MKNYKMIRSKDQKSRCKNGGSGLYCECGCQVPHDTDPDIDLSGITVSRKSEHGYADFVLARNGVYCGNLNTQYNALSLDGIEFLGVDKDFLTSLKNEAFAIPENPDTNLPTGDSLIETTANEKFLEKLDLQEQDERNKNKPGYCTKCHSFCYGDCEAN